MNPPPSQAPGCDTHGHIPDEVRTVVELLADRLQPWLQRMARDRDGAQSPEASSAGCAWCPICALITALRGDRPEAVARLAQHGAGLIAAARELLVPPTEPAPSRNESTGRNESAGRGESTPEPATTRSVQHITVRSAAPGPGGTARC